VWAALNQTLGGKLIKSALASTEHYETKSKVGTVGCSLPTTKLENDPILIKTPWWGGSGCPDCPVEYATSTCSLGDHPAYVVRATDANDVATAVKFADQYNVRLVVKNTGHDFMGR
jgi:hypothetical protein